MDTLTLDKSKLQSEIIKDTVKVVVEALKERGYNPVNQLAGYIVTGDPAYITSYKNARAIIQAVNQYDILNELIKNYIDTLR